MQPYQIYKEKVDISRVPRIYLACYDDGLGEEGEEKEDGVYMFPGNDDELLDMTPRPMMWPCKSSIYSSKLHHAFLL